MKLASLRQAVCDANRALIAEGLVTLTWGNVSGIDRDAGLMAIKPSGVAYDQLRAGDIVLVDLDGRVAEGELRPSSDTPTHLVLYRRWSGIGGITHTHSRFATVFAQARQPIPCLGTTHADHFATDIPVTRPLRENEVADAYERHTGEVIVEAYAEADLDPLATPGVLVAGHAPFAWGQTAEASVHNAVALEAVAHMAWAGRLFAADPPPLEPYVLNKHHERKHGPAAYYGQNH